ncbi:MAG: prenyltransferase/squalene oxidase repeat-containing protein [Candidatus Neomarinimicrobiota bacterium]|nr:terpene cyclase/mutase family protein [Candidatus Neomarinimicrobiota bacterium]MDX9780701.1 terpene cyclase/mutase family protein [bacterium]
MQKGNKKIQDWFEKELRINPLPVLEHGYHPPVRYEILKSFYQLEHDDPRLLQAEQDVRQATRRVTLLLTLERIIFHIDKFEEEREEEKLVKLASIVRELRFYHCSRNMTAIRKALALLVRYQREDGSFPVSLAANVFIIEAILSYGIVNNPYMEKALRWLLTLQNSDKGWGNTEEGQSDIWLTCSILHAFSYNVKYTRNTKIRKGADFILSHLYESNKGGVIESKEAWEVLADSYFLKESFTGGILAVLEMLARLNFNSADPRIREMLNWLKDRQLRSGLWPSQTYDLMNRKADERVSLRVVRVFKLFLIMPKQGSATIKTFRIRQEGRTSAKKPAFITDPLNHPKPEETERNYE